MTQARPLPPRSARDRIAAGVLLLALTLLLSACAGFQRPPEGADYGPPPAIFKDAARAHIELDYSIAPGSRFDFGNPVKAYMNNGLALGGEVTWLGHVVDVTVTSPGADGLPGEPMHYMVFFRDDRVVRTLDLAEHPLVTRVQ